MTAQTEKPARRCFEPGFEVALRLRPGTAPIRSYVGKVAACDEHGVRITLVDWLMGSFAKQDLFVPWSNIEMAYIAPEDYEPSEGQYGQWQKELGADGEPETNDG